MDSGVADGAPLQSFRMLALACPRMALSMFALLSCVLRYCLQGGPESNFYELLNQDLRQLSKTFTETKHDAMYRRWAPYMALFMSAMDKCERYSGKCLRGLNLNVDEVREHFSMGRISQHLPRAQGTLIYTLPLVVVSRCIVQSHRACCCMLWSSSSCVVCNSISPRQDFDVLWHHVVHP